ncbi:hypothetical protein [Stenotrophomonas oahuensis]|uniref:DUF485 domain-containing protein n=1 Tax=Stenotrophomonas oahuensis TaxID=3003271 RepID=A0ABY9YVI6_9GAMM|nr:hypothetical protein [Stenotrophomonas sp. A5586]WNH54440.1 hypothetical protein PDM29_09250 [Stenotrophomonas sp. A5586]
MNTTPSGFDDLALRRRRARRTAMVVGAVAVAVYLGFILSGVIGR